jgi:hypothetical protein
MTTTGAAPTNPTAAQPPPGQHGSALAPAAKSQSQLLGIITNAVSEVVNLRIITVVTPVSVGGTLENPTVGFDQTNKVGAVATCINLLEGDITTAIDPVYASNADDPVRQYHEAQVQEAKEIVDRNLKTIADLIERLWDKVAP